MALALQTPEETKEKPATAEAAPAAVRPKVGARPAFLGQSDEPVKTESAAAIAKPTPPAADAVPERHLRLGTFMWVAATVIVLALALRGVQPAATTEAPVAALPETAPVAAKPADAAPPSQGQSFIPPQDITSQIITMPRPSNETPEAKGTRKELLSIINQ